MQMGRLNGRCGVWAGPWERRILLRERNGKGFCFLSDGVAGRSKV